MLLVDSRPWWRRIGMYIGRRKGFMGYKVRLQKIECPTNKTFCVTVPVVMVEAMELKKGDELEWFIEDKNTMILRRKN